MVQYCSRIKISCQRWKNDRPGKEWIRCFRRRWSHRVRVRRPTNIKRSRAKVSPDIVRSFFTAISPNLQGVQASNIYNYDETGFKDDPGAEEAFFGGGCKNFEKIQNHSKSQFSVMFCVRLV